MCACISTHKYNGTLDGVFGPEGIRVVEIFAQDGVQGRGTYDELDTITIILNEPTVMDFGHPVNRVPPSLHAVSFDCVSLCIPNRIAEDFQSS